jgi:two-component sensor histidine kinase
MGETSDHSIRISVRDDGVGLPPTLDVQNAGSLGFQLITTLVEQLNGSLEVKRERGTQFVVLF